MAKILIKNGRVWNGEKFFFFDVMTDGEKISKIAPNIEDNADFTFDARGKTVCPGLVDAHVHVSGGHFGTHPIACTIPFGVTAVADAGVCCYDALNFSGVKHVAFANVQIKNNHAYFKKTLKTLSKLGDKAIGVKIYFDSQILNVSDITALKETVEFARRRKLIVMVHSSNSPVSMELLLSHLDKGDILTHAYHGGKNTVTIDEYQCIKNAKARGVIIDLGMAGNVHTNFEILKGAIKSGQIPDVISTDLTKFSAYKRGGKYGLTMCMSIARYLGMKEEDIFKATTSNPSKALKKVDEWGSLAVGKNADVCVLEYKDEGFDLTDEEGNNVKSDTGYRNVLTILDGEVVYRR